MKITIDIPVPTHTLALILQAMADSKGQLRVEDAASLVPIGTNSFGFWFKENARTAYREKLLEIKLEIGRTLLITTGMSIPAIAEYLGYSGRNKFEESFKEFYGVSPAQYRRDFRSREMAS